VEGIYRITQSSVSEPLNLGSDRMVTVDELVDIIANAAGKTVRKQHDLTKPQACEVATATTPSWLICLVGDPRLRWKKGWQSLTVGSNLS